MQIKPVIPSHILRHQKGFTLIELILAMAIFSVLAVVGWQVFDNIYRSNERAKLQTATLTQLQYGYAQLQRDMMQVVAYQIALSSNQQSNQATNQASSLANNQQAVNPSSQAQPLYSNGFKLEQNQLSFLRHADPDPRYSQSHMLERIVYEFSEDKLIRKRYTTLSDTTNERPLQSIVIEGVENGQFQVLTPQPVQRFPIEADQNSQQRQGDANSDAPKSPRPKLPKGLQVSFNVQMGNVSVPIEWVYSVSRTPPALIQNPQVAPNMPQNQAPNLNNANSQNSNVASSNNQSSDGESQNNTQNQNSNSEVAQPEPNLIQQQ